MNDARSTPLPRSAFFWNALLLAAPVWICAQTAPTAATEEDVVRLEEFVVETIAEGQAAAIREQRDADNIRNVVTSDAIGRLPDFSIGEALSRIPGIAVQKDRGEPEYITIRGAAPRLNSVALNGERIPSTADTTEDRNDRSVKLNSVPTALISAIEVAKAVTPDMDADAVGGAVNLRTRSPLDLQRRVFDSKLEWGRNQLDGGTIRSANFTFADRFGARDQLGLLVGASFQRNDRTIHELNYNYGNITLFGSNPPIVYRGLQDLEYRFRFIERDRRGANARFDWSPSDDHRFHVRGFFNRFRDTEERIRIRNRFNSDGRALAGSGTDPDRGNIDGHRTIRQDRQGYKNTDTEQFAFGGQHSFGDARLDYGLAYSKARFEVDRVVTNWENRLTDAPNQRDNIADVRFDATDFEFPTVEILNPAVTNPARFVIRSGRGDFIDQDDFSEESDTNLSLNYTLPLSLGERTIRFKTGYRARLKETETVPGALRYTRNTGTPNLTLNNFLTEGAPLTIFGDRYSLGPRTDFTALRSAFFDNRGQWTFDESNHLVSNVLNTYSGEEDIHAGYAMGTTDLGPVRLVAGVRYENTRNAYSAFRRRTGDVGLAVDRVQDSSRYDHWFPGVLATWRLTNDLLLRAAWTNTIARPNYKDLAPYVDADIQLDDPLVTEVTMRIGNPNLKPFESVNWDLSLEWYYQRTGYVSVGLFYKDITNFEFLRFTDVTSNEPPPQTGPIAGAAPAYRIRTTQPVNGPSARLQGIEFALSHKFDTLPKPLNGLGVIANATFIDGRSELPPGESRTRFDALPGQVDKVYNLQIYWEDRRFALRAAWNYNGGYLESLGAAPINDFYVDVSQSIDLSFEWKIYRGHRLYAEVKNVTNEYTDRKYQGRPEKPTLREEAGRVLLLGAKLEF
jgi:TonB-dependent receptor